MKVNFQIDERRSNYLNHNGVASSDHPWTWYDGTELEYEFWGSHEDAKNTAGRDCAAMGPFNGGMWQTKYCSDKLFYSCKKKKIRDIYTFATCVRLPYIHD